MTPVEALSELLGRVGANQGSAVLVDSEELNQWPSAAVKAMKSQKLLVRAAPAKSALCRGCEEECVMPVHTLPGAAGSTFSFIVCDKRDDVNRIPVSPKQLIQWQCSADSICRFVAVSLVLRSGPGRKDSAGRWEIGITSGAKRSQMLCLEATEKLELAAGNSKIPLAELIEFHDGKYSLDDAMIRHLVDAATTVGPRYTPSNVRRESRKLDTQAMYESWQKAYRELRKKRPNMSDLWYSKQIARMKEIAHDKDAETIRKHMKG